MALALDACWLGGWNSGQKLGVNDKATKTAYMGSAFTGGGWVNHGVLHGMQLPTGQRVACVTAKGYKLLGVWLGGGVDDRDEAARLATQCALAIR